MTVKTKSDRLLSLEKKFELSINSFRPFEDKPKIAIAVSGGADSLALTFLANNWVQNNSGSIIAFTINHGLRENSEKECLYVNKVLKNHKIPHYISHYSGDVPVTGVQNFARDIRYKLLAKLCREFKILHLLVAHHLEDQKETILMRSWQGSGAIGLAGMTAVREEQEHRIIRPLLNIDPIELKNYLKELSIDWVEDKSNHDKFFLRVNARLYLKKNDLKINHISSIKRIKLENDLAKWFALNAKISNLGYIEFDLDNLLSAKLELAERILGRSILFVSGQKYFFNSKSIVNLLIYLRSNQKPRTLGGCLLYVKNNRLSIIREIGRISSKKIISFGPTYFWDGRFRVSLESDLDKEFSIGPLGQHGLRQIQGKSKKIKKKGLERLVYAVLPALWDNEIVVAVPHLDYNKIEGLSFLSAFNPRHKLVPSLFAVAKD